MGQLKGLVSENAYAILNEVEEKRASLIAALQELQVRYRYLPEAAMRQVAARLRVPVAQVYHVATFYSAFSLKPKGKHIINVCLGTACHVKGAGLIMDRFKRDLGVEQDETTRDGQFTLQGVRCIGCCSIAPTVMIDTETHAYVRQDKVPEIIKKYRPSSPVTPVTPVTHPPEPSSSSQTSGKSG